MWNYKVIGRYELPWGIGSSGSWRVQSGQNYGRTIAHTFPGDGARVFRVEPITANRYEHLDLRPAAGQVVHPAGPGRQVTFQLDGFNLMNSGAITLFRQTTRQLPRGHRDAGAAHLPRRLPLGLLDSRAAASG